MGANIPLPALQVRPAPNPLESLGTLMQMRNLGIEYQQRQQQIQMQQQQMQMQQQQMAQLAEQNRQTQVLNDAVKKFTTTDSSGRTTTDHDAVLDYLAANGAGKDLISYRTNLATLNKEQLAAEEQRTKTISAKLDAATRIVSTANDPDSWEAARQKVSQELGPQMAQQMGDYSPQQKEIVMQWGQNATQHADYTAKLARAARDNAYAARARYMNVGDVLYDVRGKTPVPAMGQNMQPRDWTNLVNTVVPADKNADLNRLTNVLVESALKQGNIKEANKVLSEAGLRLGTITSATTPPAMGGGEVAPEGMIIDTPKGRQIKRGGQWVPYSGQ